MKQSNMNKNAVRYERTRQGPPGAQHTQLAEPTHFAKSRTNDKQYKQYDALIHLTKDAASAIQIKGLKT